MARVTDPVCGMTLDSDTAAGQSRYQERTYSFCSQECLRQFERDPARYAGAADAPASAPHGELEQHEPPYTKSGWFVAPKFGAAGSGGAEYEPLPEAHDDRDAR